jgi:hypothetical protein
MVMIPVFIDDKTYQIYMNLRLQQNRIIIRGWNQSRESQQNDPLTCFQGFLATFKKVTGYAIFSSR